MPIRRSFKTDESFLEKLALGAVGAQAVFRNLQSQGHRPIELERGSMSCKIWKQTLSAGLYATQWGQAHVGDSLDLLPLLPPESIDLAITSPPFALQRKKEYGNENEDGHVNWLLQFAEPILRVLKPAGSFVLDLGGAYQSGRPVRSLYNFRVMLRLCDEHGFHLAEPCWTSSPVRTPRAAPPRNSVAAGSPSRKTALIWPRPRFASPTNCPSKNSRRSGLDCIQMICRSK